MGRVHSIQSLGTVDGPGIRYVVFLQGCHLRCSCCHNPDTWHINGGKELLAKEIIERAVRYKEYFGRNGGITLSGGEPLLQPEFAEEIFRLSHLNQINTCLDTSGALLSDRIICVLRETDRVLLDIKYTRNDYYEQYVGCTLDKPLEFLGVLDKLKIPTTVRQVIIPNVNDDEENIWRLNRIISNYSCVDSVELLPFRKICQVKYDEMGIQFPFSHLPEADNQIIKSLSRIINLQKR